MSVLDEKSLAGLFAHVGFLGGALFCVGFLALWLLTSERMLNWSTHACSCTSSSLSLTIFRFPDSNQNRELTIPMEHHIPRIFGFLSLGCSLRCKKASEAVQEYRAIEKDVEKGIDLRFRGRIGGLVPQSPATCAAERSIYHTWIGGSAGLNVLDVRSLDWKPVHLSHQRSFECLMACHL